MSKHVSKKATCGINYILRKRKRNCSGIRLLTNFLSVVNSYKYDQVLWLDLPYRFAALPVKYSLLVEVVLGGLGHRKEFCKVEQIQLVLVSALFDFWETYNFRRRDIFCSAPGLMPTSGLDLSSSVTRFFGKTSFEIHRIRLPDADLR